MNPKRFQECCQVHHLTPLLPSSLPASLPPSFLPFLPPSVPPSLPLPPSFPSSLLTLYVCMWMHVSCDNHTFSPGVLYAYLAEGVGRSTAAEGAFRALSRGFTHWASGRLEHLEINIKNPSYCHVRSNMKPSMKQGSYDVYLLLERTKEDMASIHTATCQCTAGYATYMYSLYTFNIIFFIHAGSLLLVLIYLHCYTH